MKPDDDPKRVELPPMFSWLCTQIPEYPDTLNLKMRAPTFNRQVRPRFELEPTDHPLSKEYHGGITAKHIKDIMISEFRKYE